MITNQAPYMVEYQWESIDITQSVEARGQYVRQSGGRGQYGDIVLRVSPNEAGKGFSRVVTQYLSRCVHRQAEHRRCSPGEDLHRIEGR